MKKTIKKLAALLLAGALAATAALPAMATSIKVDKPANAKTVHTYDVYQIFTGVVKEGKLTEIQYGENHPDFTTKDDATNYVPKTVLDGLTEANIRSYANGLELKGTAKSVTEGEGALTVDDGYYLLKDVSYTTSGKPDDSFSAIIVQVINGDVTITPKRVSPTVDKEVLDDNVEGDRETKSTDGWGETADHEIGESFQFRLTAILPASADYAQYPKYTVKFNDTMSTGVTFESIDSVYVDGVEITPGDNPENYKCSAVAGQDGGPWTLTIDNLKAITGVDLSNGANVVVTYNAHLNANATITTASGSTINENKVSLTYSNNPDATGKGGTDTTEEDHVWVFTYGNTGTKTDATGEKLAGAGFQLHVGSSTGTVVPLYKVGNEYYVYHSDKADDYSDGESLANRNPANEMLTTDDGIFNIKGLDIGTYVLVESTVPEGYVKAADTTVTITATHEEKADGTSYVNLGNSTVSETIVNYTGTTLPSTGGMGTTIFYVIGGILVLAAAIILISRRRVQQ